MGGFGDVLGRVFAGAAEGAGNYLTQKGMIEEKAKQDSALMDREMALARFKSGLDDANNDKQLGRQMKLTAFTEGERRVSTQYELIARARAEAQNDARDFATWKQKHAIEFQTWKAQQGITLKGDKAKIAYEAEMKAKYDADRQGLKPIGDGDIDAETGTRVLMFTDPRGNVRTYDTGVVVQEPVTTTDKFGNPVTSRPKPTKAGARGWRDASANAGAPEAPGEGKRTDLVIALDQLATVYGGATPQKYPGLFRNGQKIPYADAQQAVRQRFQ